MGFAIPISQRQGRSSSGCARAGSPRCLGVHTPTSTQPSSTATTVAVDEGAYVQIVDRRHAGGEAGIEEGDVVVAVDGNDVTSAAALGGAIRQHQPGDEVRDRASTATASA